MLHKCVKIIILLSTTWVFTGLAYSPYSGKPALREAALQLGRQTSAKQGNSILLQFYKAEAEIVWDHCNTQKALYMGQLIVYTDTAFMDGSEPLVYQGYEIQYGYGYVTSALFLNAPMPHIGIVIDGMAFTLLLSTLTWKRATGVGTYVSHMSALQCCFKTQDAYTALQEINSVVLLFSMGTIIGQEEVYVSYDGGFTYTNFYVASTSMQILRGIYRLPVSGNTVALVHDEQYNFYFRNTENWATSQLSESFPLTDPLEMLEVILVAGLRGHLILWSPRTLLYSPHDGTVLVPVSEFGYKDSAVPPPYVIVQGVTTAGNGAIAIVTSDGGLYYGRLGLKAVVVKFPTNVFENLYSDRVMYFDQYTDLVFLEPMFDQYEMRVSFRHSYVHVQQQLTQTSSPVISCPVERFSGDFDGKLFYIDKGDSLKLSLFYVPTPNCPFFPVVTLTNADALDTEELILMDGTTPDGYKTFTMEIGIKLSTAAEADIEEKGLCTISVDLMEREVSCNNVNPQKVHVMMACPPGKHIRVMRNSTACTRGTFTPEQLNNFTYTIPKEVYDPDLLFRPNVAKRDLTVKYSYFDHLCPLLVYYDMPWRPTFELWDGDTFVEVVKADFVMYEAYGMHNYKYLQTAKTAKCVSQPQDWISMLQITPYIYSAWSKQNYRSCKDYHGPPLTDPDAEYQVLSQNSRNKILFSNYNGMYRFTAVVVDPHYSFCTLTTTFTVYVYGAFPKRILPYGVLCGIFIAILTVLLLIGYFRQRNILTKVLRTYSEDITQSQSLQ